MAANISRRKAFKVEGLADVQKRVSELKSVVANKEAYGVVADAGDKAAEIMVSNMRSKNWPDDAVESVFSSSHNPPTTTATVKLTALAGVRKRGRNEPYSSGYREWNPGRQVGSQDKARGYKTSRAGAKQFVIPGTKTASGEKQKIGENLATMFEFGTTKMPPRPALRPSVPEITAMARDQIIDGLKQILVRYEAKHS